MDRTLKKAKRRSKRRVERNSEAWKRFCPDGVHCRFCKHDGSKHLLSSGQPHFYRPATEAERRDPHLTLYRHTPVSSTGQGSPEGGSVLVRRMTVANEAELITAFCTACAEDLGTHQVLCYQRTLAIGEVVGLKGRPKDIGIAA